jgi:hypothetical protein
VWGNKGLHRWYFYRFLGDKMFCRVGDDKMERYLNPENNFFYQYSHIKMVPRNEESPFTYQ